MRILWVKAPFLLRRHPPVLAAVVLMSMLVAVAAAAPPLIRAGVQSESLRGQLRAMSPLAAGLEVRVIGSRIEGDRGRRAAALRLARGIPDLGRPTLASMLPAQLAGSASPGLPVVALARTGAVAHVRRLTRGDRNGVWIAASTATAARLRPGDVIRLTEHVHLFFDRERVVSLRVAGIYASLDGERDDAYWANWLQDIRTRNPDSPPLPAFVLMPESALVDVATTIAPYVENRFEFPVDPARVTFTGAGRLDRRFTALAAQIDRPGSPVGCEGDRCRTSSSLTAALTVAASNVAAVSPTIALLSACGVLIGLGLSVAAGLFLVRRRADEAHVLFARGESTLSFAARTGVEAVIPTAIGLASGLGLALAALRGLAPAGTADATTLRTAALLAAGGCALSVAAVATGAAAGFPRRGGTRPSRRLPKPPWELAPLAAFAVPLALVLSGHALAHDPNGADHPRLAVFVLPILAAVGAAGLAVRAARGLLRGRGGGAPAALFLALRRVGAARGLLVAVVVAAAAAFGTFAYAATLSASLERSTAEKAYVANGSDVQAVVDPANVVTRPFPFPVAIVEVDQGDVSTTAGERVDLIAGDPAALAQTIRWGAGWSDDPRPLLRRLRGPALAAIATPGAPATDAIVDQGARIPIRIVGHAPFPGTTAGRPAYVVSRAALHRAALRAGILDPGPGSTGLLWAKGPPSTVEPALRASNLAPGYMTRLGRIRTDASVTAAARSYRYVKLIGAAAAVLSLVALLLYLQARQRSQLIASALVRRMGLGVRSDAAALGLEAGAIVLFAALVGGAVATLAARPIVQHVDSLPQYAPVPVFAVPWTTLGLAVLAVVAVAAAFGAAAVALAGRSDVAEALRVA